MKTPVVSFVRFTHAVGELALCVLIVSCETESTRSRELAVSANALSGAGTSGASCIPVDTIDSVPDQIDEDCDGEIDEDVDFSPHDCPAGSNVIEGTRGDDVLTGTSGADCILGYGGNDTLHGGAGNDFLAGGPGNDSINTGTGQDTVFGGVGDDQIEARASSFGAVHGGSGDDIIFGSNNTDNSYGDDGDDTIHAGNGRATVHGGNGDDVISGGNLLDTLYGDDGNDTLTAGAGPTGLYGGRGNDTLTAGTGSDTLRGDDGNDTLRGGTKSDAIYGGTCDDLILSSHGDDTIQGGAGIDACPSSATECELPSSAGGSCTSDTDCAAHELCASGVHFCVSETSAASVDDTCDGLDDDCDGDVDEDFVTHATSCGVGVCASAGTATCTSYVYHDTCQPGQPMSSTDATCDGLDDNCNGTSDEDFAAHGTSCGLGACASTGSVSCTHGSVVDSCHAGSPAAADATCNAVDDNCNGAIDEGYVPQATSCGVGACAATGVTACNAGHVTDSCAAGTPAAGDATCDGVDDDCDGRTDESYASVLTGTSCGTGVCMRDAVTVCSAGQLGSICEPGQAAAIDLCNGVDDDCDGTLDEDFVPSVTSCSNAGCVAAGVTACVIGVVVDLCTAPTPAANDMTCDGIDDDCNGVIDDGYVPIATACGVGACASTGMTACVNAAVVDGCAAATPAPNDATCDGIDDDCDGNADDDFVVSCAGTTLRTCVAGSISVLECSDGDACNGVETCSLDGCMPGAPPIVDDQNPCTFDGCDPANGATHLELPAGTSCSDGDACNGLETCRGPCVASLNGMTAWWPGDGNANAQVGGFDGVVQGGVSYTPGLVSQAFQFHGASTERVRIATQPALDLSTMDGASFSGFFRTTSDNLVVAKHTCGFVNGWFFYSGYGCYFNGQIGNAGTGVNTLDGEYHHFACVKDGTSYYEYIDGVLRETSRSLSLQGNSTDVQLGGLTGGSCQDVSPFAGDIDEIQLYDRALSAADVAALSQSRNLGGTCKSSQTCLPGNPAPPGTICSDGSVL